LFLLIPQTSSFIPRQIRNKFMKRIKYFTMELHCFADSLAGETRPALVHGDTYKSDDPEVPEVHCISNEPSGNIFLERDCGERARFVMSNLDASDASHSYEKHPTRFQSTSSGQAEVPFGCASLDSSGSTPQRSSLRIPKAGSISPLISTPKTEKAKLFNDCSSDSSASKSSRQSYGSLLKNPCLGAEDTHTFESNNSWRPLTDCCAICLEEYHEYEKVCWSSNPSCPHVFHLDCVMDWFVTKEQHKQQSHLEQHGRRRSRRRSGRYQSESDAQPTCPCCRQHFLIDVKSNNGSMKDDSAQPFQQNS
jgi:hypothetical protein